MINIAVMGYGTVGSGVVEVLRTNGELINERAQDVINVKYVLDLRDFPGDPVEEILTHDFETIVNDAEVDIVVETMGGVEPAYTFVKRCLEAGKNVATSNKALVAKHGAELLEIARDRSINFMFEASVGGGIPIIRALNSSLTADRIDEVTGITANSADIEKKVVYKRNQGTIDVTYIDESTGQVLTKKDLSGGTDDPSNYTTADDIKAYTDKGYELVSDDYPSGGTVFTDDPQHYVVKLKHGLTESTDKKAVNQVIHYVYEGGGEAATDHNATVDFSRTITTDRVTNDKTYGDWTADNGDSFASVTSPVIDGYTADQLKVSEMTGITVDTEDISVTVTYTRNQGTIDVIYIDETTGKILTTKDLSGGTGDPADYATADTIKSYTDKGYELVSNDYPKDGTKFADDPQHYIVRLKHGTVVETENKSVNEDIHYVYDNGDKAADNYKATIVFSRTITTDKVTGEKTYSDWTADNGGRFAAVLSPIIKDYIASQLKIDEMTGITVDTADIERIVVYHKVPAGIIVPPVHPDKPSQPSNNQSKTPTAKAVKDSKPTDVLPSTGDSQKSQIVLTLLGIMAVIVSPLALLLRRKKQ